MSQPSAAGRSAGSREVSPSTAITLPGGAARSTASIRAMRSAWRGWSGAKKLHGGDTNAIHGRSRGRSGIRRGQRSTSPAFTSQRSATPSSVADRRIMSAVGKCRSTNTAFAAPRLTASKPRAPVPANRSRARAPRTSVPMRSKSDSRTRSFMGRVRPSGLWASRRPRRWPPTIRGGLIASAGSPPAAADAGLGLAGRRGGRGMVDSGVLTSKMLSYPDPNPEKRQAWMLAG